MSSIAQHKLSLTVALICVTILGIAFVMRAIGINYGLVNSCLAAPAEDWLYSTEPLTSLYTWSATFPEQYPTPDAPTRQIATTGIDLFVLRLLSLALGMLTVAGITGAARRLNANWWWLVGLWVAVFPSLVESNHYVLRDGPAVCAVSLSLWGLVQAWRTSSVRDQQLFTAFSSFFALSLSLLAPPLWWLIGILLYLQRLKLWRLLIFIALAMLILFPTLHHPLLWIASAQYWDAATISACILCLTMLIVWKQPQFMRWMAFASLAVLLVVSAILFTVQVAQRIVPDTAQWALIEDLQNRIADGSIVQFDRTTFPLAEIIRCPHGANLQFTAQPPSPAFTFTIDPYPYHQPAYIVGTDLEHLGKVQKYDDIEGKYYVGYNLPVDHMIDVHFGDLFSVINAQIKNPVLKPGDALTLRFDYQLLGKFSVDALRYQGFIHVIFPDRPADKIANLSVDFISHVTNPQARQFALNQENVLLIPADTIPGKYQVIFGIFDIYSGKGLTTDTGQNFLPIGEITVEGN